MIKFNELQTGDFVMVEYEGKMWEGEVTNLNHDEKQVEVTTEVQPFWYAPESLHAVPLNDQQLMNFNFTKQVNEDGSIKYMKEAFRLVIPSKDDFSTIEMWYREDRRHHPDVHFMHQLQNHYYSMTKVHLTKS
ncbi:MAG TPA: hypothetical protein PKG56_06925 [Chitinophagaceae bacterium]|nr:hypothetical protein [Chitinophagaceae bacterium]MCC6635257.1 hypothetical protein [Chitinophagaceae bacterium]HMZ46451.1 hypothetical protein [Chitinophagaceae bacterium]HNF29272.1 hypothetical protein [Chitinophagaceae bacterium]HNJ59029.1 hypothetical protein [Chitinophagaceae bacterium]